MPDPITRLSVRWRLVQAVLLIVVVAGYRLVA